MADIKSESLAGLKSEWVAGFILELPAGFVGIRSSNPPAHRGAFLVPSPDNEWLPKRIAENELPKAAGVVLRMVSGRWAENPIFHLTTDVIAALAIHGALMFMVCSNNF